MQKLVQLVAWLIVNVVFGFLQLICDFTTKSLTNGAFDSTSLIIGGGVLFFSSAFIVSVAFESWVSDRSKLSRTSFALVHIIVPFILLIAIIMIYLNSSSLFPLLVENKQKQMLPRLWKADMIVLVAALSYGIYSKFEQIKQTNSNG
jgi:Na+/proline symporter